VHRGDGKIQTLARRDGFEDESSGGERKSSVLFLSKIRERESVSRDLSVLLAFVHEA
jgi:hypothetical protein